MAKDGGAKLSKNLLRMKFMQRGLDAEVKKQLDEEEKRIISDDHWFLDLPELKAKENYFVEERSFVPCEGLVYGRMSFKGFNPDVQKLMLQMNAHKEEEEDDEEDETLSRMETDITDEEMARRYESLVGSMRKKFAKKRDRSTITSTKEDVNCNIADCPPKRAFMKPQD